MKKSNNPIDILDEQKFSLAKLSETKKNILFFIHEQNMLGNKVKSQKELARILNLSASTISKYLKDLEQGGFISSVGKSHTKEYFISSSYKSNSSRDKLERLNLLFGSTPHVSFDVKTIFIKTAPHQAQVYANLLKEIFPKEILSTFHNDEGILVILYEHTYDIVKDFLSKQFIS